MTTETTFYRVRRACEYNGRKFYEYMTKCNTDVTEKVEWATGYVVRGQAETAIKEAAAWGDGFRVITVRHKLIPAKPRTHDRAWALRQLAKGRAVTRPDWTADTRVEVTDLGPRLFTKGHLSESILRVDIGRSLAEPDGYTLWQEPGK